jgi:hypothetical protein
MTTLKQLKELQRATGIGWGKGLGANPHMTTDLPTPEQSAKGLQNRIVKPLARTDVDAKKRSKELADAGSDPLRKKVAADTLKGAQAQVKKLPPKGPFLAYNRANDEKGISGKAKIL